MVDAAVGSKAIFGRGIEKKNLGLPTGDLSYFNFISIDIGRNSKENPSQAITGFGGRDRGTPGEATYGNKLKYDLTVFRILFDLAAMYGAPASVADIGGGVKSVSITAAGSGYLAATVSFAAPTTPGGVTATGTVNLTGDAVSSITIDNPGSGYTAAPAVTISSGSGTGATGVAVLGSVGSVEGATITDGGTGYSSATVAFDPPGSGVTATGTVTVDGGTGKVTGITIDNPGSGYDTVPAAVISGDGSGAEATVTLTTAGPWLVKFRPGASSAELRALWFYLHEGGSYTGLFQYGRRCKEITLTDAANKRVEAEITYEEATGDTISGNWSGAVGNTGTEDLSFLASRGRRPYDSHFTAGDSIYVKVISSTEDSITLAAKFDVPAFAGAVSYGSLTFTIARPSATTGSDGWGTVIDSNTGLPVGLFGENFEPFEVTFGDQDLTTVAANDEFEIPVSLPAKTKVVVAEHRLSEFHLLRTVGSTKSIRIDTGSTKWMRPYKPYYANGRKLPFTVDPTDDIGATVTFDERLVDRYFREIQDAAARFTVEDVYKFGSPLSRNVFEGIHTFYAQMAVTTMKTGDIPNKNALKETITLEAEQPGETPTPPDPILCDQDTFDADASFPFQINIVTPIDPSAFA